MESYRFSQAARRHRIGKRSAMYVIRSGGFSDETSNRGTAMRWWVGPDDRGRELEIGAVRGEWPGDHEDLWIVIHVFPTALRDKERE